MLQRLSGAVSEVVTGRLFVRAGSASNCSPILLSKYLACSGDLLPSLAIIERGMQSVDKAKRDAGPPLADDTHALLTSAMMSTLLVGRFSDYRQMVYTWNTVVQMASVCVCKERKYNREDARGSVISTLPSSWANCTL